MYLGDAESGMEDLQYASKEKQTEEHNVIDEAIQDNANVFLPPYASN
jgi:hypothetical protein